MNHLYRPLLRSALVFLFAHALLCPTYGQTRRIDGTVADQKGLPLPRVLVEVRDPDGRLVMTTSSNSRGQFVLELSDGRYSISADLAGFARLRDYALDVTRPFPLLLTLHVPSIEQQIVVTATRTEVPAAQVASTVTVLSGEALRSEGSFLLADALRRVPGLIVAQGGPAGQLASVFIRGGESDYTKVLIDGIAVNEPGGAFNFGTISTLGIDRIEIVRGPQSALFGSDAIAGVIQIFTRRGEKETGPAKPGFSLEGGTFSTFRYGGALHGGGASWDYMAAFSRLDTDGHVRNGSFNSATAAGNFGYRPTSNTELRAVLRTEAGRTGVPGQWAFHRPEDDEHFRRRDVAAGFTLTHDATVAWTQKLQYSINDSRQLSIDPGDSGSFVSSYGSIQAPFTSHDSAFQTLNDTRRQRLSYQSTLILPHGHVLSAGADYEHETGVVGDPDSGPLHAVRNNAGAFLQDEWGWRNRFFATAGARLEHNASFGFFAAPRVSLAAHLRRPSGADYFGVTKVKASFGLGIKEPTLVESFSDSPFFRGNPNLQPERSISFDAGVEQYIDAGRGVLEINYFENRFRDQIGFAITDFTTFEGSFFNIGKTLARGIEAQLQHEIGDSWDVVCGYTFTHSRVVESSNDFDPVFAAGQELLRRPRHAGHVDLRWSPGRWTLGASALLIGNRADSDFAGLGLTRNAGYELVNVMASYRISREFSLYGVIHNILNQEYMEILGFPAMRAHFRIGLRAGL
jgi:outer membrane cobalamin receptor